MDAFEINFSCPHGMPERKMGAAMGQDCTVLDEVCGWVKEVATVPVWAKMTPNITDITVPAKVCLEQGMDGIAAINTIMSIMGVNLDTLAPEPCVEGHSTPGGYSYKAVRPIALAKCMTIAQMIKKDFPDRTLSGIGGIDTGDHAAEFILLGSDTVQVCTGVMIHGYPLVQNLCAELQEFMGKHGFESIAEFKGMSLEYFTTHTDLVARQKEAIEKKKKAKVGIESDDKWTGEGFVAETESMVSNV